MTQNELIKFLANLPTGPNFGQNGDNVVFTRGGRSAQPMTVSAALLLQWIGQNIDLSTSVTYSEAQTLVNAGGLVPGQLYTITNATAANGGSGSVTVQAISTTQFAKQGAWIRPISQKAFGYVRIDTMAGADELSDITVNGVSVLANPVVFDTDIYTTVGLAVAEVTLGGYTAYQAGNAIVLVNDTAGATPNTHAVVSTGTGTYVATDGDIRGGASGTNYALSVEYDFTTNSITWAFDPVNNITFSGGSLYSFPWGEELGAGGNAQFTNGTFEDCSFSDWYFSGGTFTSFFYSFASFSNSLWINIDGEANHLTGSNYANGALFNCTIERQTGTALSASQCTVIDATLDNNLVNNLLLAPLSGGLTDTASIEDSIFVDYTVPSGTGDSYAFEVVMGRTNPIRLMAVTNDIETSIPAGYSIAQINIFNTTANAVTGGIRIGTTAAGTDVVVAQAVGANAILTIADADVLLKFFSTTVAQSLFIEAVTAWNSANLNIYVVLNKLNQ